MVQHALDSIVKFMQPIVSGLKNANPPAWYSHTEPLPLLIIHQREQTAGIDDEFVQEREHIVEAWALAGLLLPAVQHQLVQCHGAAHRCW